MPLSVFILIVSRFFWEPYWIPAGSMKPALLVGDYVVVVPTSGEVSRGDILVFEHPTRSEHFVKRLIGMPGERVQLVDGVVMVNGVAAQLMHAGIFAETMERQGPIGIVPICANGPIGFGAVCEKERFIEVLPDGTTNEILNIGARRGDNTGVFTVPEGHYFLLGDNRDNSSDSRVAVSAGGFGFVPEDAIMGKAERVLFSSSGTALFAFWTWRKDRYFEALD